MKIFLEQYGGLEFTNVKFRPGQAFTTGFGLDNTFGKFRIHNAIDRGNRGEDPNANLIYAPFDGELQFLSEYGGGFGSLLRLKTAFGFEVRIMHMEGLEPGVVDGHVTAGTLLGHAGVKGIGTGRHTHTEVVSVESTNEMLNEILEKKHGVELARAVIDEHDAAVYMGKQSVEEPDYQAAWDREIEKRGIAVLRPFSCLRIDYHDARLKTFYSSQALFGF